MKLIISATDEDTKNNTTKPLVNTSRSWLLGNDEAIHSLREPNGLTSMFSTVWLTGANTYCVLDKSRNCTTHKKRFSNEKEHKNKHHMKLCMWKRTEKQVWDCSKKTTYRKRRSRRTIVRVHVFMVVYWKEKLIMSG